MPDLLSRIRKLVFPLLLMAALLTLALVLTLALQTTAPAQQPPISLQTPGAGGSLSVPAVPTPAPTTSARPTPSPGGFGLVPSRPFYCSCSTGGQQVAWSGRVLASGYTLARQAAAGQCSRF